jgi:hypothetical protein
MWGTFHVLLTAIYSEHCPNTVRRNRHCRSKCQGKYENIPIRLGDKSGHFSDSLGGKSGHLEKISAFLEKKIALSPSRCHFFGHLDQKINSTFIFQMTTFIQMTTKKVSLECYHTSNGFAQHTSRLHSKPRSRSPGIWDVGEGHGGPDLAWQGKSLSAFSRR